MSAALTAAEQAIIAEEQALVRDVQARLAAHMAEVRTSSDFDSELLALRDQLQETRAEDHAMLVEHMTRLAALRSAQDRERVFPADPSNPYFAHLRLTDVLRGRERVRDVLVGRRAFIDSRQGVQIVDWRNSPISRIYYCYAAGDDYEEVFAGEVQRGTVDVRRTVTIADGELLRVRDGDTVLVRTADGWQREAASRSRLAGGVGSALRAPGTLGGKPDDRLPEITALIDPEQFRIISGARSGVVIIRGGAGTGKTTIALHRAAFLHFEDPRKFAAKRMLVITPGDALRRYVAGVLPSLDVAGVAIRTFSSFAHETVKRLVPALKKRKPTDDTPIGARRLKRHPFLLNQLDEVVLAEARAWDSAIAEAGGDAVLRAWVSRRNLPVMVRLERTREWAEQNAQRAGLEGSRRVALRKVFDQARKELGDPVETWAELLTNRSRLAAGLAEAGADYYQWELDQLVNTAALQVDDPLDLADFDASHRQGVDGRDLDDGDIRGRLDVDDAALLMRICQVKYGRMTGPSGQQARFEHVVVDEAQDHSPLCIQVLCGLVPEGGPVTLAGDTAQRLVLDNGFADWDELAERLHLKAHVLPPLSVTYRSTRQVMALARHVLGPLAREDAPRDAHDGAPVELLRFAEQGEAVGFLADALRSLRDRERRASVALVARTPEVAEVYYQGLKRAQVPGLRRVRRQDFEFSPGIDVTDVMQIKGLEYDYVVLLEATAGHFPRTDEARFQLHVIMTRAAHQLWLVCSDTPSLLLPDDLVGR